MMTFIETFKKELAEEAAETKRMLAQVPADKYDWQPHPRSMKMGVLAYHLAEIPDMIANGMLSDKWDFGTEPWEPKVFKSNEELLAMFETSLAKAMDALEQSTDDILQDKWQMTGGEVVYLEIEKWETFRHAMGQNAHHRAQLQVYLRLLDIPVPGPYGPSADEMAGLL